MSPDPLDRKSARKVNATRPSPVGIPVELSDIIPHGVIGLGLNEAGQLVRVFARHMVEIEALTAHVSNLRVIRFPYPHPPTGPPITEVIAGLLAAAPTRQDPDLDRATRRPDGLACNPGA